MHFLIVIKSQLMGMRNRFHNNVMIYLLECDSVSTRYYKRKCISYHQNRSQFQSHSSSASLSLSGRSIFHFRQLLETHRNGCPVPRIFSTSECDMFVARGSNSNFCKATILCNHHQPKQWSKEYVPASKCHRNKQYPEEKKNTIQCCPSKR